MPTYEYKCRDCGHHLEVVQSFTDDALTDCPSCEGSLRKVFSPVGITFKGSGFYKTDSRSGNGTSSSSSSSSSSEGSGASDSGSSDGSSGDSKGSTDKGSGSSGGKAPSSDEKAAAKK